MTVSVVIGVYNGGPLLREAVHSVFFQTRPVDELVLVDDGSTDGAAEAIAVDHPRIRFLRQPNAGGPAARNAGIQLATSDLITFLDADDLWPASTLESHLRFVSSNPDVPIALGQTQLFKSAGDGFVPTDYRRHLLHMAAGIFRRSVFDRVGLLEESMRIASDMDWWLRAKQSGMEPTLYPDLTLYYRHHEKSVTGDVPAKNAAFTSAVHRALKRRRSAETATPAFG